MVHCTIEEQPLQQEMQIDQKLASKMTPPPQRRGGGSGGSNTTRGGGGNASASGGRGRPRGGGSGGRGSRGTGASAAPSNDPPPPTDSTRVSQTKNDKPKSKSHRKSNSNGGSSGARGGGAGGPSLGRSARVTSLVMRKVLLRNIPHDWDEEKVLEVAEAYDVTRQQVWRFVPGKVRSNNRAPLPGRMYLDFKKDTDLAKRVIDKLNGYITSDDKNETKLEAEFAPFQKIHREKQRKDPKVGTIDRDPDFLAFLEELNKPKQKLPSADVVADSKESESAEKPVSALVLYLNTRRRDKKGKHIGKLADKARGTRGKAAKEGKGTKEKGKGAKGKSKGADTTLPTKDPTKSRKVRGKSAPASRDKSVEPEEVESSAFKVTAIKTRASGISGGAASSQSQDDGVGDATAHHETAKGKSAKGAGAKGSRRGGAPVGPKDASGGDAATAPGDATKERKNGARGARDGSRSNKGLKCGGVGGGGGGRGDQPKKVFAPKVTTPAG